MPETLTIAFSGLMIFHEDKKNNLMEIGILRQEIHVPRILTMTNGVLARVLDLRTKPELNDVANRTWVLEVSNPVKAGIRIHTQGGVFDRRTHPDERDFRWTMDFEGSDFYDKELDKMMTEKLMPVLQIPHGEFYTKLKSEPLGRRADGGAKETFGAIAGVTGLDIEIDGGSVSLKVKNTDADIFRFKRPNQPLAGNTIFEIANTPPDVFLHPVHGHEEHDHFQFYYDLFTRENIPRPRFSFEKLDGPAPAPFPRLCGKGGVGLREEPL